MGYSVFLSHGSADAQVAKWIKTNAQTVGIEVYLYEDDPQPGRPLADKLKAAIQSRDALVVLLTGNSQFSTTVHQEIGIAKGLGKRIVPLVQPGFNPRNLAMLQGVEYIPFDFNDPQTALATLIAHLQKAKEAKERSEAIGLLALAALIVAAFSSGGRH